MPKGKRSRLTPLRSPGRGRAPRFFLREQTYRSRSKQRIGVRRMGKQTYRFPTEPSAGLRVSLMVDDSRKASSRRANLCPRIGVTVFSINHPPKVSAMIRRSCPESRFVLQNTLYLGLAHTGTCPDAVGRWRLSGVIASLADLPGLHQPNFSQLLSRRAIPQSGSGAEGPRYVIVNPNLKCEIEYTLL